jgi:hypothetical protein
MITIPSGPQFYCFGVEFHRHCTVEEIYYHHQATLPVFPGYQDSYCPGQGAIDHPHFFAPLQIAPGVIMAIAGRNGPDGLYLFRRYRNRGAVPQKATDPIDFDYLVEYLRIDVRVDKKITWE